jgi:hypothetical protein
MNRETIQSELVRLSKPGVLEQRLAQIDKAKTLTRIYIMGCGRSGTWLLTSMFSTFRHVTLVPRELPVEYFGLLRCPSPILVTKRNFRSYERVELIPDSIKIAWIVRHPFDVLTSKNPRTRQEYHIPPWRFLGEMLALQYLEDTNRQNTLIVRYEDLVKAPAAVQATIACAFKLEIEAPPDAILSRFRAPPEASVAMHGLRPIDTNSLNKYRDDSQKITYLKTILPRIHRTLSWVAQKYAYDITLTLLVISNAILEHGFVISKVVVGSVGSHPS